MKKQTVATLLTILFLVCAMTAAFPAKATPRILEVGKTGYPYATISAAVAAASPGDTILVHPGIYTENVVVNTDGLTIRSGLLRRGWCRRRAYVTIVDGDGSDVFTIDADDVTIDGFTIRNGDSGILYIGWNNKFTQNIIHNNEVGIKHWFFGTHVDASYSKIEKNEIYGNNIGIHVWFPGIHRSMIIRNNIHDNAGSGMSFRGCSRNTIGYNNIHDNGGSGIALYESDENTIVLNRVVGNVYYGVRIQDAVWNNTVLINTVKDNGEHGIYIGDFYESSADHMEVLLNKVINNGGDGIHIGSYAYENRIEYNIALNNYEYDLYDEGVDTILNNNIYGTSYP